MRLPLREELEVAHSFHSFYTIGGAFFLFSIISLSAAIVVSFSSTPEIVPIQIGPGFVVLHNIGEERSFNIEDIANRPWSEELSYDRLTNLPPDQKAKFTPYIQNMYEMYVGRNPPVDPKPSIYHFPKKQYYIQFGTSWSNMCNYTTMPNGLISILRTLELHVTLQVVLRTIVLFSFSVRWYATLVRCAMARTSIQNTGLHPISIASWIAPSLQLVEGAFTALIVILHQDQDESVTNLFSAIFAGLIVSSCANMLVYTIVAAYDGRTEKCVSLLRLSSTAAVAASSPLWFESRMDFLRNKSCWAQVPMDVALAEYLTALAIMTFAASQIHDMRPVWGLLSADERDVEVEISERFITKYEPESPLARTVLAKIALDEFH